MNKTIIAPLLGLVCLMIQAIFHVDITGDVQSQIIDTIGVVVSTAVTLYGIFKNHKTE